MASSDEASLLEVLDPLQVNCLNEASDHTLKSILELKKLNTSTEFLVSDADEQLLLNIPFNQSVRIKSIVIRSQVQTQQPRLVKLFINRPSIGFDDVDGEAAQIIDLTEDVVTQGQRIPLRFVRFQNVNSLHIFVVSNGGDELTRIDGVDVLGVPTGGTRDLTALQVSEE
jgi:hypothetical protein